MRLIRLIFAPRYSVLLLSVLFFVWILFILSIYPQRSHLLAIPLVIFGGLTTLGLGDLIQKRHSLLRNYPILAHLRFLIEEIRPEIRQYLFENETNGAPFSRDVRALVYQRAKTQIDKRPFGAQLAVYSDGFEWMLHSLAHQHISALQRARMHETLFGLGAEHFGYELRRAERERHSRPERRGASGEFRS